MGEEEKRQSERRGEERTLCAPRGATHYLSSFQNASQGAAVSRPSRWGGARGPALPEFLDGRWKSMLVTGAGRKSTLGTRMAQG